MKRGAILRGEVSISLLGTGPLYNVESMTKKNIIQCTHRITLFSTIILVSTNIYSKENLSFIGHPIMLKVFLEGDTHIKKIPESC